MKPGGFRPDGEERGDRGGRALIDIRHPELERHGGDLEAEAHQDEQEAEEQRRLGVREAAHDGGELGEIGLRR